MRDPARIIRIIEKLALQWQRCPDLRLRQLCDAIVANHHPRKSEHEFYMEDDEFETALDEALANPCVYVWPKTP